MAQYRKRPSNDDFYGDVLVDSRVLTDPSRGSASEDRKLLRARNSIDLAWRRFDGDAGWAQAHLTGYAIFLHNPEFVEFLSQELETEITEDSHILELIGWLFVDSSLSERNADFAHADKLLRKFEDQSLAQGTPGYAKRSELFRPVVRRTLQQELLSSKSIHSNYWRRPLQRTWAALNEGEVDELSERVANRRQGRPYSLKTWKLKAIQQIYFRVGYGMKKYRAKDDVALGIGQSADVLKDWEQELKLTEDFAVYLRCSKLAGRYQNELKTGDYSAIPNWEGLGSHRGTPLIRLADILLDQLEKCSFEVIKRNIKKYRQKTDSGG